MDKKFIFEEAFNLLCGRKIGEGIHRTVYACRIDPKMVVKVEHDTDWFVGSNAKEYANWEFNSEYKKVSNWLAPCAWISPNGRVMLQHRTQPMAIYNMPKSVPAFFTDIKPDNWGWYGGRAVCHDYPQMIVTHNTRMKKVEEWFLE
jgi:hypothetical protein